jgi:hypothetical protein
MSSRIKSMPPAAGVKGGSISSQEPPPSPSSASRSGAMSTALISAISAPGRTSIAIPSAARRSFSSSTSRAIVAASLG